MSERIEPVEVVSIVEEYVRSELHNAEQYDNRQPLDESGIWSLHALAARIYAIGWVDAEAATERKWMAVSKRESV